VRAGRTEVIELDGMPIGVQLVDRPGTHIQLEQLYIEKAFQGQGFGTHLINQLFVEARESNLPIRLRVLAAFRSGDSSGQTRFAIITPIISVK
jgi:GNAT superfamily N-acetyltransferase